MSTRLPIEVNPYRMIEQARELDGTLEIKSFTRISDLLADDSGTVSVSLSFYRNESGLPAIRGQVSGQFTLICQRCMEPMSLPIEQPIDLVLISNDEEAQRLQAGYETYLVEDSRITIQDFVEDEVLLGIPQLVMHDQCEPFRPLIEASPETVSQALEEAKENPFAVLQNLKNPGNQS